MTIVCRALGVVALTAAVTVAAAQAPATPITLKSIKYADLGKFVRGLTGKVVVVDFWAEY